MKRYFSVNESAEYLSTSVRFVRRLVSERRITFYKVGSHVRISLEDLEAFIQDGRVNAVTTVSVQQDLKGVA
jgi:excisionase family DNA binding protein